MHLGILASAFYTHSFLPIRGGQGGVCGDKIPSLVSPLKGENRIDYFGLSI